MELSGNVAALALLQAALLFWSWKRWADIAVDSGYNLYTTWQLSSGKVLYVDLAYYHGPLAPYADALAFHFLGESILSLAFFHALIAVCIAFLIGRIFLRFSERWTAFGASALFLILFACSQYTLVGNYNFVMPYKSEAALGVFFCVAQIFFCTRALESPRALGWIAAADDGKNPKA